MEDLRKVLIRRTAAAQATVDRFRDVPFGWGVADCARLAAFCLRELGHATPLAKAGRYRTEASARAALKRAGFDSLEAALDARFPRIPAASAIVADIVAAEGEREGDGAAWPGLMVAVGNGRTLGFHEGYCRVLQPLKPLYAWRVDPCRKS